jgi:hypothetical protein
MSHRIAFVRRDGTFDAVDLDACQPFVSTSEDSYSWVYRTPQDEYIRFVTPLERAALDWSDLPSWFVARWPAPDVHCALGGAEARAWLESNGHEVPGEDAPRARPREMPCADPLEATLALLDGSPQAGPLVELLWDAPQRTAHAREIARRLYSNDHKRSLAAARRLIRRTGVTLDGRKAPIRLSWDRRTQRATLLKT